MLTAALLCGCSASRNTGQNVGNNNNANNEVNKKLDLESSAKEVASDVIGEIDLKSDEWTQSAYIAYPGDPRTWSIVNVGDGTANYRNVAVKSDALALEAHRPEKATLPAGINPISLYIGSESWKDYSLSFDFLLNDNGGLEFTVYHLSGLEEWDFGGSDHIEKIPIFFNISKAGLWLDTGDFPAGYAILNEEGENILGSFDAHVWNNVKLTLDGLDLHLIFNGEDKGVIWTYESEPGGPVGFWGADGVMIKDIKIVHQD